MLERGAQFGPGRRRLLEEKGTVRIDAEVANWPRPGMIHGAESWAGFSAYDSPVDSAEIESGYKSNVILERSPQ